MPVVDSLSMSEPTIRSGRGLPLIAKDTIKDALTSVLPIGDVDASRQVGQGAVDFAEVVAFVRRSKG